VTGDPADIGAVIFAEGAHVFADVANIIDKRPASRFQDSRNLPDGLGKWIYAVCCYKVTKALKGRILIRP
jgi:hypothetical protein